MKTLFVCGYSRSGTTLLTAMLESNSETIFGFEIIPLVEKLDSGYLRKVINSIINECKKTGVTTDLYANENDSKFLMRLLIKELGNEYAAWVRRLKRSGTSCEQILEILSHFDDVLTPQTFFDHWCSWKKLSSNKQNVVLRGCKLFQSQLNLVASEDVVLVPYRNPLDVFGSLKRLNFPEAKSQVFINKWNEFYSKVLSNFNKSQLILISYEDLVKEPDVLNKLVQSMGGKPFEVNKYFENSCTKGVFGVNTTKDDLWRSPILTKKIGSYKNLLNKAEILEIINGTESLKKILDSKRFSV